MSPPIIHVSEDLISFKYEFIASLKWPALPLGCLYIQPTVIDCLSDLSSKNNDSTIHFVQLHSNLNGLFSFKITTLSNLSLLTKIPAPPLFDLGSSAYNL